MSTPNTSFPTAGLLLCVAATWWTSLWGRQMQYAQAMTGEPTPDMTNFWLLLSALWLLQLAFWFWAVRLSKPSASQVCYKRRPLLESQVQRLALRQLIRIEAGL